MVRKATPTRRPEARRRLEYEVAKSYEQLPDMRPDGLPRELERHEERDGFEVHVTFRLTDDDEVVIDRVIVGDNRRVKGEPPASVSDVSRLLARLPLARWQREALDAWPEHAARVTLEEAGEAVEWRGPDLTAIEEARKRLGGPVGEAARIYEAFADTKAPTKAVAEQLAIPYETARSRIRAARERGLLPPTTQGKRSRPDDEEE